VQTRVQQDREVKARALARQTAALAAARCLLVAPLERMRIVLQVDKLANFANPADRPKGVLDLANSKKKPSP